MNDTEIVTEAPKEAKPGQTHVVDVVNMPWQSAGPKCWFKTLWRDEASGAATVLFKFEPGAQAPAHSHLALEQTFVLEGVFQDHDSVITAGNFAVREAGSSHKAFTREGSLHLAFFSGPVKNLETGEVRGF